MYILKTNNNILQLKFCNKVIRGVVFFKVSFSLTQIRYYFSDAMFALFEISFHLLCKEV